MGRLKVAGSSLKVRRAPLQAAPGEQARSRSRDQAQPWRAWYKTARWRKLRREVLKRDGYKCRQTGQLLVDRYPADNSAVVDHITPHRGDPELFWDEQNLQSVTAGWHNSTKQSLERRGLA